MSNSNTSPDWYRYSDLQSLGYGSRVTIWRKVKEGKFPAPIDDGIGRPAWLEARY